MKAPLIHLASLIFDQPLAILPEKLETILRAIGPRLVVDTDSLDELLQPHVHARPLLLYGAVTIDAQSQNGNGEDSKPYRLTPEGVAVIPVRGTLMKRFSYLGAASGFSSYAGVLQASRQALEDPQVKAVLFDIDSPGGTTHGCFELSDALYEMRNTEKPVWACANDLAASAAYALASAADRIWLTRTAGVGSVGVFALHMDQSHLDEQAGVKFSYIFAGDKKTDGNPHEPLSKSARPDIQAEVDREYQIFVATVARNRGANISKIADTEAAVYFADKAMPLLADEVGTFDEALEAITAKVNGFKVTTSGKAATMPAKEAAEAPAGDPEGGKAMAKLTEDEKRAKAEAIETAAAAAADKKDPPDTDDDEKDEPDDDDDDKPKDSAKSKGKMPDKMKAGRVVEIPQAANGAAKRIANLCQIAGAPELAAEYLMASLTVDEVIEKLSERRAKASAEGKVNSFVAGDGGGLGDGQQMSVDAAIKQAGILSANSGGALTQSKALERLLRSNPAIYNGYLEEKDRVASQIMFSGGGRALNEYVLNNQRRYLANLGLSTAIEDVPSRRSM